MVFLLLATVAQAQTARTWDGGGIDNNWSTSNNWSADDVPDTTAEAALFTDDPIGQTRLSPNLSADVTIGQLQFSATAPSYSISGTGLSTLFLNPTTSYSGVGIVAVNGAANQAITAAEVEFLASQTWNIDGTTVLTVTGTIEDDSVIDYGLTKNGTGTVVFPGDVRYDGPTIVNAGSLILSFSNTSMLSALTVNGGILRGTTNANALGNNATRNAITLNGGALELGNNTGLAFGPSTRRTTVSGNATIRPDRITPGPGVTHTLGTLSIGPRTLTVSGGALVNNGTAGLNFGTTTFSGNGAVFDVASAANLTLGALTGNFTFTKQGNGQLTLNTAANANRTSAGAAISNGTVKLGNASALGTTTVPLTLNGGTLDLAINSSVNAHNTTVGGHAIIASDRSSSGIAITHNLGTLAIGTETLTVTAGINATSGIAITTFGSTTLSGNATFEVVNSGSATAQLTLGAVTESGGTRSLTKIGNGTLFLNGTANYTGGTTLSQGTITLGVANALGNGEFNFAGGTLNANNTTDNTIGALAITANSILNLSPGGASAILTFAGISGIASGFLTINGWSGSPGGSGSDDKIIFSGGITPDGDFLQHIQFDLGGGNIQPAVLGPGGEIFPFAPPTPTPTPTPNPTPTPSPTATPLPTETPTPTPTPMPTSSPTVTQTPAPAVIAISGNVSNCSSTNAATVADVTLSLTGDATISVTTDTSGNYQFSALPTGGSYIVSVSKPALQPGSPQINTIDVVATQRHFLDLVPFPPGCRRDAADANGDTEINTIDLVAIQRFFLGLTTGTANVGKYRFSPSSRAYLGIATDQTQENYEALVFGDVAAPFTDHPIE